MKIPAIAVITLCCHLTIGDENWKFVVTDTIARYRFENHYYALQGETVSLICRNTYGSENCSTLNVYKGIHQENAVVIVGDGKFMATTTGRYRMAIGYGGRRRCQLFMYDVSPSDSSPYVCTSLQIMGNMSARVVSNFADLHVVGQKDQPNFCDVVSGVDGFFFTGDDLTLRCPNRKKLKIKFKTRGGADLLKLDNHTCVPADDNFCFLSVEMNANLNDSSVSCIDEAGRDFCKHIPQIRVFDDLTVFVDFLEWNEREMYVTVVCRSIPSLLSPIKWEIFGTDVIMEGKEDLNQLKINFKNLSEEVETDLEVSCEIQVGTKSSKTYAVYSSTSFTSVQTPFDVTTPFYKLSTVSLQQKVTTQGPPIYAVAIGVFIILVLIVFFAKKGCLKKKNEFQFQAKASVEAAEQDYYYGNVENISSLKMQANYVNANTYSNLPNNGCDLDCSDTNESLYQNVASSRM